MGADLSERDMADLAALADGTLEPARRAQVEARVAASAELQALLERQRDSLAATGPLTAEPVPSALVATVGAAAAVRRRARRQRRTWPALAAAVAAAVVVVVVVASLGGAAPSLSDAARLAGLPPTAAAPAPLGGGHTRLAASVQGVVFPDLQQTFGWRASGLRRASLEGRPATVVSYTQAGRRIAYVVVGGSALARPSPATVHVVGGTEYQTLTLRGLPAVTWRQSGHTCLLTGAVRPAELLALAAWSSGYDVQS
jgi:anti-sigma factor RsiW